MLVIRARGSCDSRLGRYSGSGMFDAIGRKLFSSGFKKAISSGVNSAIAHICCRCCGEWKYFNITKGWKSCCKRCSVRREKAAESAVNNAIDSTKKWFVGRKRSIQLSVDEPIIVPQYRKLEIDSLIDGSGIVLD